MIGKGYGDSKGTAICKTPIIWTGTHVFKARLEKSSGIGYIGVVKYDYDASGCM